MSQGGIKVLSIINISSPLFTTQKFILDYSVVLIGTQWPSDMEEQGRKIEFQKRPKSSIPGQRKQDQKRVTVLALKIKEEGHEPRDAGNLWS